MEINIFPITDKTKAQIESVFTYHKPANEEVAARCQEVRTQFKAMAIFIAHRVPEGRELSLALTQLEYASMEAIAGIVRA